jgi:hypothetical protein
MKTDVTSVETKTVFDDEGWERVFVRDFDPHKRGLTCLLFVLVVQ